MSIEARQPINDTDAETGWKPVAQQTGECPGRTPTPLVILGQGDGAVELYGDDVERGARVVGAVLWMLYGATLGCVSMAWLMG